MMSSHSEAIDEIPLRISALVAVGLLMFVGLSSAAILMLRRTSTLPSPSPSPLQLALQSGVLRLGVETRPHVIGPADYQTRRAANFVAEVGAALAQRFGVQVRYEDLHNDAHDALAAGKVDLLLSYKPGKDGTGTADDIPIGESSILAPLMRNDTTIRSWEDLRGRSLCISTGQPGGEQLAGALDATIVQAGSPAKALADMRSGECDAAIVDAGLIDAMINAPTNRWLKFSATLPPRGPSQLTLTLAPGDLWGRRILQGASRTFNSNFWTSLRAQWSADVDFEAYLEQDAPDCH